MVADFGDYSTENDTYELLSQEPLHVRFSPLVFASESAQVVSMKVKMALVYGILRSFMHTWIERITVTAIPQEGVGFQGPRRLLQSQSRTISATRARTLAAIQKFFPGRTFSDLLVTPTSGQMYDPDEAGPLYDRLSYSDQGSPGIDAFLLELER